MLRVRLVKYELRLGGLIDVATTVVSAEYIVDRVVVVDLIS